MDSALSRTAPYNFEEWAQQQYPISLSRADLQYAAYLKSWYSKSNASTVKEDYYDFLRAVSTLFGDQSDYIDVTGVDFTNDREVLLALPVFVSSIKKLALRIAADREELKHSKIKYNLKGSKKIVERITENIIYTNYEEHLGDLPVSVEIEDLFDDNDYFEEVTTDFDFLSSFSLKLDEYPSNPLLKLLAAYTQANLADPRSYQEETVGGTTNADNIAAARDAYAAGDVVYLSGGSAKITSSDYILDIEEGLNTFYWPTGDLYFNAPSADFVALDIQESEFVNAGATGALDIADADTLWITNEEDIWGAWLYHNEFDEVEAQMSCYIKPKATTIFKWPYCGYGIHTNDTWSGKALSNINQNTALNDVTKAESNYWNNDTDTITSADSVSIHETTLIADGAKASIDFSTADSFTLRASGYGNNIYQKPVDTFWCYALTATQLPITVGSNYIHWPYFASNEELDTPFEILPSYAPSMALSAVDMWISGVGSVAGDTTETADIVYRKECGEIVEAAYLNSCSIASVHSDYTAGNIQPGLSIRLTPGINEFIYGEGTQTVVSINDINALRGIPHESYCSYLKNSTPYISRSNKKTSNCDKWEQCDCRAVFYSPLGHNGASFTTIREGADFIIEDADNLITASSFEFDPRTWRDVDGNDWETSPKFAYFKLDSGEALTTDYGQGEWVSTGEFKLTPGVKYIYGRMSPCCDKDQGAPLVVNWGYCNCGLEAVVGCDACQHPWRQPILQGECGCLGDETEICCRPQWMELVKNAAGEWEPSGEASTMVLYAGDDLEYVHQESYKFETALGASYEHKAVDFVLNVPITARSFWALKPPLCNVTPSRPVYEHLMLTQPEAINTTINNNQYFEYNRKASNPMIWSQPVTLNIRADEKEWRTINITSDAKEALVNRIINNNQCTASDLIGATRNSASSTASDILLRSKDDCGNRMRVFYCAKNPFTVKHTLDTVGDIQPIESILFNEPLKPWANLENIGNILIGRKPNDTALFEEPKANSLGTKNLGVYSYANDEFDAYITNDAGTVTSDPEVWPADNRYVRLEFNNLGVLGYTNGYAAGIPDGSYGDFTGYSSTIEKFELSDDFHSCATTDTLHATLSALTIVKHSTDLYGNHYALYKPLHVTKTDREEATGILIFKNQSGMIEFAEAFADTVESYTAYQGISASEVESGVIDFFAYHDTMVLQLSSTLIIDKVEYIDDSFTTTQAPLIFDYTGYNFIRPRIKSRKIVWGVFNEDVLAIYEYDTITKSKKKLIESAWDTAGIMDASSKGILTYNDYYGAWTVVIASGPNTHEKLCVMHLDYNVNGNLEIAHTTVYENSLTDKQFTLIDAHARGTTAVIFGELPVIGLTTTHASSGNQLIAIRVATGK